VVTPLSAKALNGIMVIVIPAMAKVAKVFLVVFLFM
jgi:hypothetical protein